MRKPESVLKSEAYKIVWDLEKQTDNQATSLGEGKLWIQTS